jgi:hypothetical protein
MDHCVIWCSIAYLNVFRAREIKEEIEERLEDNEEADEHKAETMGGASSTSLSNGSGKASVRPSPKVSGIFPQGPLDLDQSRRLQNPSSSGFSQPVIPDIVGNGTSPQPGGVAKLSKEQRQRRVQDLRSKFDRARLSELRSKFNWGSREGRASGNMDDKEERQESRRRERGSGALDRDEMMGAAGREDLFSRLEGSVDDIQVLGGTAIGVYFFPLSC